MPPERRISPMERLLARSTALASMCGIGMLSVASVFEVVSSNAVIVGDGLLIGIASAALAVETRAAKQAQQLSQEQTITRQQG